MVTGSSSRVITLRDLDMSDSEIIALTEEVCSLCDSMDIDIELDEARLCVEHLLYVQQVNEYMNLTRIKDIHEALILHIVDSLTLARDLPIEPERFLDMGTGAGFPGIPFHILSGCEGVLLDSVGKKIDAVNAFIHQLGLEGIKGVHDRLETYALKERGGFDIVFARAVGQLNTIIEYGTPFLEDEGYLVLAKANPTDEERRAGNKVAERCGLDLVGCDEFELPEGLGHRAVFLYEKVDEPKIKLPRAVGLAKKSPLAS